MGILSLPLTVKVRKIEMSTGGKIYGPAQWYERRYNQGRNVVVVEQPQYPGTQGVVYTSPTGTQQPQY